MRRWTRPLPAEPDRGILSHVWTTSTCYKPLEIARRLLCQVIEQTGDLTLLTDGEKRYGSLLFELCSQALRTGKRGRPKKTLPKGVKVRLKNKGSQRHKRGRKRPKYQAPYPEHPDTAQPLATTEIHANHLEAFHTSLRRRCAAYRRRTNMYESIPLLAYGSRCEPSPKQETPQSMRQGAPNGPPSGDTSSGTRQRCAPLESVGQLV